MSCVGPSITAFGLVIDVCSCLISNGKSQHASRVVLSWNVVSDVDQPPPHHLIPGAAPTAKEFLEVTSQGGLPQFWCRLSKTFENGCRKQNYI